jgi:concanavalin A-like lectin/glucanase superfamily protein/type IX secretion system substrate protein/PKD domain-containing protein
MNFIKSRSRQLLVTLFIVFLSNVNAQVFLDENQLQENHFPFEKTDHSDTDWWQEMNSASPNVLNAESQFNDYFSTHFREKSLQKKLFIRWLQDARLSMTADGEYIPHKAKIGENNTDIAGLHRSNTGTWSAIGPNYAAQTTCGTTSSLTGGFCDRVYINPYNTNNLFAGYSYGGLWVSQDQGQTWSLTDSEFANGTNTYANRDYYYGDIEASKIDSSLVFAATESGLLKSINSGQDWSVSPELNRIDNPDLRPYYVALSNNNSEIVLSTFGRKVFRSEDGGNSWVMTFDNSGGGPNHTYTSQYSNNSTFGIYQRTYNFFGLEADHDYSNVFYLGGFNSDNEPCIYKSIDSGLSFTLLINLNTATGISLPNSLHFRTIPAQPDKFYVFGQFANGNMYHFDEDGTLISQNLIDSYVEAGDINWLNEEDVYTGFYGASSIMKSTDGGLSFTDMTSGYGGCPKYVHPDVRDIDVVGDIVLIASDGGIAMSTDAMETVNSIGREISSVDLWGFSSSPHSDIVSAGCDHGPTKIRRFAGDNGWISRGGGDAGQTSVNQSNDHWIYFDHGYGIFKTELADDYSFVSTEAITPQISLHRVTFHPNFYKTAFGVNGNKVEVTENNFSSFTTLYDFGETVNRILIAPDNTDIMYVLLSNNEIKKSIDAGVNWTTITPSASSSGGQTNITDIAVGDSSDELWASYGNWQVTAKILQSIDGGISWSNITSSNLPLTPVAQIVHQRGTNGGIYLAFAGQSGVFYRNNSMTEFEALGSGLPMLGYIRNIYAVPAKGKYRMGSSRGAWEHDLYEESTIPIADFAVNSNVSQCPLTPIQFFQNCVHSSGTASYEWTFEGGTPSNSTEPNPTVTYATLGEFDVTLTLTDEFGNVNTKVLNDFINVQNSICDVDDKAGKMIDLQVGQTNRPALSTVPIIGNEFTITTWVKLHELQNSFAQIVSTNAPNTRFGLGFAFMGYNPNTNLIFTSPDENYWVTSDLDLTINEWHYIAITYSPTAVKIYVDGQEPWVRTGNFQAVDFSQSPFYINNDIHNQGGNFHGQIDEVAFYNYALTQEEVREKRHLVKNPEMEEGLVTYYQFNQYDVSESSLYEVIGGHQSTVINSLIDNNSPIPVATGEVFRIPNVVNGIFDFENTNAVINFPSGSTPPNGEVVVTRLDASPNLVPPSAIALSPQYWIVNNYGLNTAGLEAEVTLTSPGFVNSGILENYLLHKRASNEILDWIEFGLASSISLDDDEITFSGITDFSQFIISDAMLTNNSSPENQFNPIVQIAPNPAKDQLMVYFKEAAKGIYQLTIYDSMGKKLISDNFDCNLSTLKSFNISSFANGVYVLVIKQDGNEKGQMKFVKTD